MQKLGNLPLDSRVMIGSKVFTVTMRTPGAVGLSNGLKYNSERLMVAVPNQLDNPTWRFQ